MSVDPDILGVKNVHQVEHNLMVLPTGALLFTDLPELGEVVQARYKAGTDSIGANSKMPPTDMPLLDMVNNNLHEATKVQDQLTQLFVQAQQNSSSNLTERAAQPAQPAQTAQAAQADLADFEEVLTLTYEDHPYLVDHSIIRQPADWPHGADLNPVAPLTMTIELLAEIAMKHRPGKKLVAVKKVSAYGWVNVKTVFTGTIKGVWKSPDVLELELVGHAKADFCFADVWQEPDVAYDGTIDIGQDIIFGKTSAELYDQYAFHGPKYHSNIELLNISERGIRNTTRKQEGKGSLLDIMGQQLGLFLHLTKTENTISFPVRLKELNFYADIFDQEGLFEHTLIITRLSDHMITGDMVLKRDGKQWAVAHGFVCQRFENDVPVWMVMLKPQEYKLAQKLVEGVYYLSKKNRKTIDTLLEKRYLNYQEKAEYAKLTNPKQQRQFLVGHMALKDAVRDFLATEGANMLYPIEVFCTHDEHGQPIVYGERQTAKLLEGLFVTLANKDDKALAMVGRKPVGIDLEKIEVRTDGFIKSTFTDGERKLLGTNPTAELTTRFWVAKEAYAKMTGKGLQNKPKQYEVQDVDGDVLQIEGQRVQTTIIEEEYIGGWVL
jgi:phosphopantetheinyl transferase